MKKLSVILMTATLAFGIIGCHANKLPPLAERIDDFKSGKVTMEQMKQNGWLDDDFQNWLDSNTISMLQPAPQPLETQDTYHYEFLGLDFTLPTELKTMLQNGQAWMYYDSETEPDNTIDYTYFYFSLVPDNQKKNSWTDMEDYKSWLAGLKQIGTIGVFKADFLKNNSIESLTKCENNEEIGKSSDGSYIFYLSTNSTDETDLLRQIKIVTSDPVPDSTDDPAFNVLGSSRKEVSALGDFSAHNLNGETVTQDVFSNYDLTLINLWTTTCGYCIDEMPSLEEIRTQLQDQGEKFNIVSMCLDIGNDNKILDKAKTIVKKTGVTYEVLIPDDNLMNGRLKGVSAFPESFFVDKEGKIVGKTILGAQTKDEWLQAIRSELEQFK